MLPRDGYISQMNIFHPTTAQQRQAAALRALAATADIQVTRISGPEAAIIGDLVLLPPCPDETVALLPDAQYAAEMQRVRGEVDAVALWLRYHRNDVHHRYAPQEGKLEQEIYEALERARVESQGMQAYRGIRDNLRVRYEATARRQGYDRLAEGEEQPVAEILAALLREKAGGLVPPQAMSEVMAFWRPWMEKAAGKELDKLAAAVESQEEFARQAQKVIAAIMQAQQGKSGEGPAEEKPDDGGQQKPHGVGADPQEAEQEAQASFEAAGYDMGEVAEDAAEKEDNRPAEAEKEETMPGEEGSGRRPALYPEGAPTGEYRVYEGARDEIVPAEELCTEEEAQRLREALHQKLQPVLPVVMRLANRLQRVLLAQQLRRMEFDCEDGWLDSRKLPRLVIDPNYLTPYYSEAQTDFQDTVVTLLIDNSGSMRGRPIMVAACCGEILARTLERCRVKTEILGFTTREWRGGEARKHWIKAGSPAQPGRLNDLRHIIYKPADTPLRRARHVLPIMLKDGLLKENIDGEAILWAHRRLLARPEKRRILMVISDGAPVDDSTLSSNHGGYLDRHLREVIGWIETRSPVELTAIGIGHDVSRYYCRAVTITDIADLADVMMRELAALFKASG